MMIWIAVGVGLLIGIPLLWFVGGFAAKILWGWWPALASVAAGAYSVWRVGIDKIWLIALFLIIAIVAVHFWQRLSLFVKVDRRLDKLFLLDD